MIIVIHFTCHLLLMRLFGVYHEKWYVYSLCILSENILYGWTIVGWKKEKLKSAPSLNLHQYAQTISKRQDHLSTKPPLPPPINNVFWSVSLPMRCPLPMNNGDVLLPADAHHACQWAGKSRRTGKRGVWGWKQRGTSIDFVFDHKWTLMLTEPLWH